MTSYSARLHEIYKNANGESFERQFNDLTVGDNFKFECVIALPVLEHDEGVIPGGEFRAYCRSKQQAKEEACKAAWETLISEKTIRRTFSVLNREKLLTELYECLKLHGVRRHPDMACHFLQFTRASERRGHIVRSREQAERDDVDTNAPTLANEHLTVNNDDSNPNSGNKSMSWFPISLCLSAQKVWHIFRCCFRNDLNMSLFELTRTLKYAFRPPHSTRSEGEVNAVERRRDDITGLEIFEQSNGEEDGDLEDVYNSEIAKKLRNDFVLSNDGLMIACKAGSYTTRDLTNSRKYLNFEGFNILGQHECDSEFDETAEGGAYPDLPERPSFPKLAIAEPLILTPPSTESEEDSNSDPTKSDPTRPNKRSRAGEVCVLVVPSSPSDPPKEVWIRADDATDPKALMDTLAHILGLSDGSGDGEEDETGGEREEAERGNEEGEKEQNEEEENEERENENLSKSKSTRKSKTSVASPPCRGAAGRLALFDHERHVVQPDFRHASDPLIRHRLRCEADRQAEMEDGSSLDDTEADHDERGRGALQTTDGHTGIDRREAWGRVVAEKFDMYVDLKAAIQIACAEKELKSAAGAFHVKLEEGEQISPEQLETSRNRFHEAVSVYSQARRTHPLNIRASFLAGYPIFGSVVLTSCFPVKILRHLPTGTSTVFRWHSYDASDLYRSLVSRTPTAYYAGCSSGIRILTKLPDTFWAPRAWVGERPSLLLQRICEQRRWNTPRLHVSMAVDLNPEAPENVGKVTITVSWWGYRQLTCSLGNDQGGEGGERGGGEGKEGEGERKGDDDSGEEAQVDIESLKERCALALLHRIEELDRDLLRFSIPADLEGQRQEDEADQANDNNNTEKEEETTLYEKVAGIYGWPIKATAAAAREAAAGPSELDPENLFEEGQEGKEGEEKVDGYLRRKASPTEEEEKEYRNLKVEILHRGAPHGTKVLDPGSKRVVRMKATVRIHPGRYSQRFGDTASSEESSPLTMEGPVSATFVVNVGMLPYALDRALCTRQLTVGSKVRIHGFSSWIRPEGVDPLGLLPLYNLAQSCRDAAAASSTSSMSAEVVDVNTDLAAAQSNPELRKAPDGAANADSDPYIYLDLEILEIRHPVPAVLSSDSSPGSRSLFGSVPLGVSRIRLIANVVQQAGLDTILDLGCGDGLLFQTMMLHGFGFDSGGPVRHAIGVDISRKALQGAARRMRAFQDPEIGQVGEEGEEEGEREGKKGTKIKNNHSNCKRVVEVSLFHGSALDPSIAARFQSSPSAAQAQPLVITMVEVVEHLDPPVLDLVGPCVLGSMAPKVLIVTTPNWDYNAMLREAGRKGVFKKTSGLNEGSVKMETEREAEVTQAVQAHGEGAELSGDSSSVPITSSSSSPAPPSASAYPGLRGRDGCPLRNSDHRFEWSQEEFKTWALDLGSKFGYGVEIQGVGSVYNEPEILQEVAARRYTGMTQPHLGHATQVAIFRKAEREGEREKRGDQGARDEEAMGDEEREAPLLQTLLEGGREDEDAEAGDKGCSHGWKRVLGPIKIRKDVEQF